MTKANTLAYYDSATITAEKSFIVQDPRGQQIETFLEMFSKKSVSICF
jgi:hypothetical protein